MSACRTAAFLRAGALQAWQRANLVAAINYIGEVIGRSPGDVRAKAVYEGLLEVLDRPAAP